MHKIKFSVLLPTRNGGPYLEDCVQSILKELPEESELIISDNANQDETQKILTKYLSHSKVKISRSEEVLSVTDNWNKALEKARGDYVLMMGDDDYLLPEYFIKMLDLINKYHYPDCILYNAYGYIAPNSISGNEFSFYRNEIFKFDKKYAKEGELSRHNRKKILMDMFKFKTGIPLNMQTILVKRTSFDLIGGKFLPPFPDHYLLNALLLKADKWVVAPIKPVIVGVSPKSFGHYIYSNFQDNGLNYLGINPKFKDRLPGNELLNGMYVWLEMLKMNFPDLNHVSIDRRQYVIRQVYSWLVQLRLSFINLNQLVSYFKMLRARDWLVMPLFIFDSQSWLRFFRMIMIGEKASARVSGLRKLENIKLIKEFANMLIRDERS